MNHLVNQDNFINNPYQYKFILKADSDSKVQSTPISQTGKMGDKTVLLSIDDIKKLNEHLEAKIDKFKLWQETALKVTKIAVAAMFIIGIGSIALAAAMPLLTPVVVTLSMIGMPASGVVALGAWLAFCILNNKINKFEYLKNLLSELKANANDTKNDDIVDGIGKKLLPTGELAEGEFKSGQLNGYGTLTFENKTVQKGHFVEGFLDGEGTITYPGISVENGIFKGDKLNGTGSIVFDNGIRFEGEFVDGNLHGQGKIILKHGIVQEGIFKEGVLIQPKKGE